METATEIKTKPKPAGTQFLCLDDILLGREDTVTVELVGGFIEVKFKWDPNYLTPAEYARLDKAEADEFIATKLAAMIKETDLTMNGEVVAFTKENLMNLIPAQISTAILHKVNEVTVPNPSGEEKSSATTSTKDSTPEGSGTNSSP